MTYHGCKVRYLIGKDQASPEATYVVYLDEELDIVWCSTNSARKASRGMRAVEGRMAFLETMPVDHLEGDRRLEFKKLLAHGMQAFLSCTDDPTQLEHAEGDAFATFQEAERRINQWNFEYARRWYAIASGASLGVVLLLTVAASFARSSAVAWEFTQFAFAGALGALLFFLVGLRNNAPGQLRVEVSGGKVNYVTTVGVKVLVGMLSALAVGVAMRADLLFGIARGDTLQMMPNPLTISALAFVACFVAGFSETLVPRFLTNFEGTSGIPAGDPGVRGRRGGGADELAAKPQAEGKGQHAVKTETQAAAKDG